MMSISDPPLGLAQIEYAMPAKNFISLFNFGTMSIFNSLLYVFSKSTHIAYTFVT